MSWIKKLVKKNFSNSTPNFNSVPDDLCVKCNYCSALTFKDDLDKNHYTCSSCGGYFVVPVHKRLELLFNGNPYKTIPVKSSLIQDPIKFRAKEKYSEKIASYKKRTGCLDAAVVAYGKIGSNYCVCFVMNFNFLGGSMGVFVGEAFVTAARLAITHKVPLLAVTASGGARMQEGIFSLMQMAKTTVALEELKDAGLPYIVLLTNPTTGGVTASFAMLGDVNLAEKGATIGFAGARVIEKTIRKTLPEGFQTAEYLYKSGMVDAIVERKELHQKLGQLLGLLTNRAI